MTDRRCAHGKRLHEPCIRCSDLYGSSEEQRGTLMEHLMEQAKGYRESRIIRAFLRQQMKTLSER